MECACDKEENPKPNDEEFMNFLKSWFEDLPSCIAKILADNLMDNILLFVAKDHRQDETSITFRSVPPLEDLYTMCEEKWEILKKAEEDLSTLKRP
ncbi:MAG: hypothetical protein LBG63_00950 [Candidatus Methanoplasma sp.]|jgi:hypothetical protein|nr:hypothetical protein [Candidatus Methanoplasma sp.]